MALSIDQALQQGVEALGAGRLKAADRLWTAAMQSNPDNPHANYSIGTLATTVGAFSEAEPFLKKAVSLAPENPAFWFKYLDFLCVTNRQEAFEQACAAATTAGIEAGPLAEIRQKTLSNQQQRSAREQEVIAELRTDLGSRKHPEVLRKGAAALEATSPGSAEILFLMGVANAGLRAFDEALYCYQRAILVNPDHDRAYFGLASVLLELREIEKVIEILNNTLTLWPNEPRAHVLLGNAYRLRNEHDKAIDYYEKALAANPNHASALNNLATCFSEIGRTEAAKDYFQRALNANPGFARAHRQLANLHRYKGDEDQLASMTRLFEQKSLSPADLAELGFGLAKAHQDLDNRADAMAYLQEANRLQKQVLNYSLETDKNLFRRITEIGQTLPGLEVHNRNSKITPIFIVGMPRSGTTLVEQIVSAHSSVHAGGELGALSTGIRRMELLSVSLTSDHLASLSRFYNEELAKLQTSRPFVTDKTPLNLRWLDLVYRMYPDAKVIHVDRDARGVCWSCFNHYFTAGGYGFIYDMQDLTAYYRMYRELMDAWHEKYPERIYDLSYEALTADQEAETRRLFTYLSLPWEDDVLNFHQRDNVVRTASSQQVRQSIYQGSSNRWRDYEVYLEDMLDALKTY